ncbi:MAG: hypothetical protein SPI44_04670 [Bacilli bacterium]|nr:hypothetical protein [Bacilli bacterium]
MKENGLLNPIIVRPKIIIGMN